MVGSRDDAGGWHTLPIDAAIELMA